ncbi:MAG: hypothetical protein WDN06_15940 [Asticcacaulis sp.]
MLAGMVLDSSEMTANGRDQRLDHALQLLQKPVRKPPSVYGALAASAGLVGAALLLAVTMMFEPATDAPAVKSAAVPVQATSASTAPAFELSASSISADPPVRDAVIAGTEGSR